MLESILKPSIYVCRMNIDIGIFIIIIICAMVIAILGKDFFSYVFAQIGGEKMFAGGSDTRTRPVNRSFLSEEYIKRRNKLAELMPLDSQGLATWHHLLIDYIATSKYTHIMELYNLLWRALNITDPDTSENHPIINMKSLPKHVMYQSDSKLAKFGMHVGQRKLLLNEIYFVCRRIPVAEQAVVVYAGSAPSIKGAYLSYLSPNVKWIFVDPNDFAIKYDDFPSITEKYLYPRSDLGDVKSQKVISKDVAYRCVAECFKDPKHINIIQAYMTDTIANALVNIYGPKKLYFISDIRTNMFVDIRKPLPDTADITLNNVWQYNWLRIMRPKYAMLKFRPPFNIESPAHLNRCVATHQAEFEKAKDSLNNIEGVDFAEIAKQKKLYYFDGDVILQPWAKKSSTEARLETDCTKLRYYDVEEHDTKAFLYNAIYRNIRYTVNPNADLSMGFDNCNDCAFENAVWETWLTTYGPTNKKDAPKTVKECVSLCTKSIGDRSLIFRDERMPDFVYHGGLDKPISIDHFNKMLEYNFMAFDTKSASAETKNRLSNYDDE